MINLTTGSVVGAEALVRWNDPERGLMRPTTSSRSPRRAGLILPIGEWVLRTAVHADEARGTDAGLSCR